MTSRDIATKLFISERTVEAHVTNMLNKLGLNSRIEVARWLASVRGTEPITPMLDDSIHREGEPANQPLPGLQA
jgi:predicted DNA-binding transcriptional regulator